MSSYLNIFISLKEVEKKITTEEEFEEMQPNRISILELPRKNDLYQVFYDHGFINNGVTYFSVAALNENIIRSLSDNVKQDIDKTSSLLYDLKLYNNGKLEVITKITDVKEELEDLKETLHKLNFLKEIINTLDKEHNLYYYID